MSAQSKKFTRGFIIWNPSGKNVDIEIVVDNTVITTTRANSQHNSDIIRLSEITNKEGPITFFITEVGSSSKKVAISLDQYVCDPGGEAFILELTILNGTFLLGTIMEGYSYVTFYNDAAAISSFELYNDANDQQFYETSNMPSGAARIVDLRNFGLKDISLLYFKADIVWGATVRGNSPILYSKTGGRVAAFKLSGTTFNASLSFSS